MEGLSVQSRTREKEPLRRVEGVLEIEEWENREGVKERTWGVRVMSVFRLW